MHIRLTIDVEYDSATVSYVVVLGRNLMTNLNRFVDDFNLLAADGVVIDAVECGVEEVHEP